MTEKSNICCACLVGRAGLAVELVRANWEIRTIMVYFAWSSERLLYSESYVVVPLSPVFVPNFILVSSVIYLPSQRLGLGL